MLVKLEMPGSRIMEHCLLDAQTRRQRSRCEQQFVLSLRQKIMSIHELQSLDLESP